MSKGTVFCLASTKNSTMIIAYEKRSWLPPTNGRRINRSQASACKIRTRNRKWATPNTCWVMGWPMRTQIVVLNPYISHRVQPDSGTAKIQNRELNFSDEGYWFEYGKGKYMYMSCDDTNLNVWIAAALEEKYMDFPKAQEESKRLGIFYSPDLLRWKTGPKYLRKVPSWTCTVPR
ncbi:hypothetical protein BDR03DRAFT_985049 [Suillus americanus]|nr:hypothetical protein BDR03DRAFT_985049 [Suillus americanus]